MKCCVCNKEITSGPIIHLSTEMVRHKKCSPLTKKYKKAFPNSWAIGYVKEPPSPPPKRKSRLLPWPLE